MKNREIKKQTDMKEYHVLTLSVGKDSTTRPFSSGTMCPEVPEQIKIEL